MSDTDFMKLANNQMVLKMLQTKGHNFPDKEVLVLSQLVLKINRKNKEQKRIMAVTNKAIYNLVHDRYYTCKRRIPIQALGLITVSTSTDEFVLHIPSEYDYRYRSEKKMIIIKLIQDLFKKYTSSNNIDKKKLRCVEKQDSKLEKYAITKNSRDREQIMIERKAAIEEVSKNDSDREDQANESKKTTKLIPGSEKISAADFELLKVLGRGSFGKVMQVRHKINKTVYAMKILKKNAIIKRDQVEHTRAERKILQSLQHPFLMKLRYAFQTAEKLYFVLDFYRGGELFFHLKNQRKFSVPLAKLYVAEIASALGHLHSLEYIYRDLKPENILLDDDGHVCLTDFGLSTQVDSSSGKATTFCGTPEYLAPEIVTAVGHDKAVDWWSLGILLYELTVGIPPFYSQNVHEMYHSIQFGVLKFPKWLPDACKDLIVLLLDRDPNMRLGSNKDVEDIKEHKFYADLDWGKLLRKEYKPSFKPTVENDTDTNNFDVEFTNEIVQDTPAQRSELVAQNGNAFTGFTYEQNNSELAIS